MSDLFGFHSAPSKGPEKFGKSSEKFENGLPNFSGDYSKSSEVREPNISAEKCGEVRISPARGSFRTLTTVPDHGAEKFGNLQLQRYRLEKNIEIAEAESAEANAIQAPYRDAFHSAHSRLEWLHATRRRGAEVTKPSMLSAYDARVLAGHKWHPHKKRFAESQRWLKALREELKAVNKEIGT